ncbi:PLP-dependent aminotransferase family protein [Streptomyces sp. NPDC046805]|uniref:MocR-like transcription factor YczR n=1 Tax=Streptomyces sp. NPDC046805 TaxID=3155134 RepID=UPI0033E11A5D
MEQKQRVRGAAIPAGRLAELLADMTTARPAYRHLATAVRTLILDGGVAVDARLPAERELAPALALSRTTISAAYEQLRKSGYAHSRRGSGTWTALPEGALSAAEPDAIPPRPPDGATPPLPPQSAIDLATAALPMPQDVLHRDLAEAVGQLPLPARTSGYHSYGLPELRTAVAARYTARGLPTHRDQILVTAGAQQALSLALSLLCGPGDRVLVESPSYPNALDAIRRAQLRPVPVPVTEDGWDGGVLTSALHQSVPRLAYLIPAFHNPTGALMPPDQCAEVLGATRRPGTWLVVDETLADMALDTGTPRPFAAYGADGGAEHVISIGSLSKTYWSGLRVGWLRASPRLVAELAELRATVDVSGSVLDQLLALLLLNRGDGWLTDRVDQVRHRRRALVAALERYLPDWSWRLPPGGLSLWVDLGRPLASALAERALAHGVRIGSGARFGGEPGLYEHRLRIPYTLPPAALGEAVRRLAAVLAADPSPAAGAARSRSDWVA